MSDMTVAQLLVAGLFLAPMLGIFVWTAFQPPEAPEPPHDGPGSKEQYALQA